MLIHALLISKQGGARDIGGEKERIKGDTIPQSQKFLLTCFSQSCCARVTSYISSERQHMFSCEEQKQPQF